MAEPETILSVSPNGDTHEIRDDGSTGDIIDKVYAVLCVDGDGEGIMGFATVGPDGSERWIPLIASKLEVIEKLAERHGKPTGEILNRRVVIAEFSTRTNVRIIHEPT